MSPALAPHHAPRRQDKPHRWTLILPGHAGLVPYPHVDEAARRIVRLAPGMVLQLTRWTCTYPGYDTFEAFKIEGLVPLSDTRAYVGAVVAGPADLGELRAAIARAAAE
ncbi:hypothetical protein [Phenylobacterium sp.]|uniref:hypothetical protein n=1 Tax=Phenylobacterium sp. TaxID=1871053 RepID=UPI00273241A8|nr:hypothetical protein [Phenylobacterium sp.]MDP3853646.1 hypothetical protein [Phenylobacterium sp.]